MRSRFALSSRTVQLFALIAAAGVPAGRAVAAPSPEAAVKEDAAAAATDKSQADEVKSLIGQLGADDFAKRERAAKRLRAIGKPALPALREAAKDEDAEVAARAQVLVNRLTIRPLPAAIPGGVNGLIRQTRMRIHPGDGNDRVIDVTDGGREIQIREGPGGITMTVSGLVDGQPGSEEYNAGSADQLREDNPEAYALYERWSGAAGPDVLMRGGARIAAGRIQINGGGLMLQPIPDELDLLRSRLDKQMRDGMVKDAYRDAVSRGIEKLAEARADLVGGMDKYSERCDEFRKTLEQYKLDAGDLLPPPAKTRLGVSIATTDGRLMVQKVGDNSRAGRIGLQPGDVIRKVDGKDVETVGALRQLVGAKEKGLVLDVTRAGEELKLEEKEAEGKR